MYPTSYYKYHINILQHSFVIFLSIYIMIYLAISLFLRILVVFKTIAKTGV
jgi:hypothetical protein